MKCITVDLFVFSCLTADINFINIVNRKNEKGTIRYFAFTQISYSAFFLEDIYNIMNRTESLEAVNKPDLNLVLWLFCNYTDATEHKTVPTKFSNL